MAKKNNKIAIFDIDGTIFRKNLHFELIDELVWMKVFPKEVRTQLVKLYSDWLEHRGTYETYRQGIVKLYSKYIKGCTKEDVLKASVGLMPFYKNKTYVFAERLIEKLKKENYHIIAVSGSPLEVVEEYNKKHLGFEKVFGSVYDIGKNGRYTGESNFEPCRHKGATVKQYVFENNLTLDGSYGIGDTESDASFLELVENPIAFNPNQNLKNIAVKKGWRMIVEKKDVIYEIDCEGGKCDL
jgi:HAD superfamily phosphoserine phosphatase-like hydrolase